MSIETLSVLIVGALAYLIGALCDDVEIDDHGNQHQRESAQSYGWADMDKVRKLDGKRYTPATDADFFIMPDGTKIHRH